MYTSGRPADFSLREVFRKMQKINLQIDLGSQRPFPKPRERLLSFSEYKEAKIRIKKGKLVGGLPRLIWRLVDFSFIRSIVADAYSPEGDPCYDPVFLPNTHFLWPIEKVSASDFYHYFPVSTRRRSLYSLNTFF